MELRVYVIDDDPDVLQALSRAIGSLGYVTTSCGSAEEFLGRYTGDERSCIVLDLCMPGMSGEQLQALLWSNGGCPPLIFISGYGDVPTAVRAMKSGAVDFLTKPIELDALEAALSSAFALTDAREGTDAQAMSNRRLYALSSRELEVFAHLVRGDQSLTVANNLGISLRTVKAHRQAVRKKLGVRSIAELARIAIEADFTLWPIIPAERCGRGGDRVNPTYR